MYGLEIYSLLGKQAEQAFTSSWGVSYGMGQISEAQDIVNEAAHARSSPLPSLGACASSWGSGLPHMP